MKAPKNVRIVTVALVGVVLLAAVAWVAAQQIKSPAQIAADTAAPKPSQITAIVTAPDAERPRSSCVGRCDSACRGRSPCRRRN